MQDWRKIVFAERVRRVAIALIVLVVAVAAVLWGALRPAPTDALAGADCRQRYQLATRAADSTMVDQSRPMLGRAETGRLSCAELRARGLTD